MQEKDKTEKEFNPKQFFEMGCPFCGNTYFYSMPFNEINEYIENWKCNRCKIGTRSRMPEETFEFPKDYTVIDIETTGLMPALNEITELAAIRYRDGKPVSCFRTFVHPENGISKEIEELTGITEEMTSDAPSIKDVIQDYIDFIGQDIVVGYCVGFDAKFIFYYYYKCFKKRFLNKCFDVLKLSRIVLPDLEHHSQVAVAEYLGIDVRSAHRALVDCETCEKVYEGLKRVIEEKGQTQEEVLKELSEKYKYMRLII